jgi:hypothetical protein
MTTMDLINPGSPDSILKKNPYKRAALARIAHVNEVVTNLNTVITAFNSLSTGFDGVLVFDGTYLPTTDRITVQTGLTTGAILSYVGLDTKTSGYLFNGSIVDTDVTGDLIVDNFLLTSNHAPGVAKLGGYDVIGINREWSGAIEMAYETRASMLDFSLSGVIGTGLAVGTDVNLMNLSFTGTLDDTALNACGIKINFQPTITNMATAYGLNILSSGAITGNANFEHILGGRVGILPGGNTAGIVIYGTVTSGIQIDGTTPKTNALHISANTDITNFITFDAAAGCVSVGAGAIPVNYAGYLTMVVGVTSYKIPFLP